MISVIFFSINFETFTFIRHTHFTFTKTFFRIEYL